jgi:hypothetical protein
VVEEEFSTDVRSTSVTLHARVNPLGSASTVRFQYLTDAEYLADGSSFVGADHGTSTPEEPIGATEGPVLVEQHLQGLNAGQAYHYHVVTTNIFGEERGEERSFTTQTGGEAGLPDGREWELVSQPDKHGARLEGTGGFSFVQAAANGDAVVYPASGPTESQPRGHGEHTQVLSRRGADGTGSWESQNLSAPRYGQILLSDGQRYWLLSSDLSLGVLHPAGI